MSTKRVPITRSNSVSSKFITPPPDVDEEVDDDVPIATADLYDPNQDNPENPTLETTIQQAIRHHYMMNASPLPTVSPVVSAASSVPTGEAVDSDVAPTGAGGQGGDSGTTSSGTGAKRGSAAQNRDESGRRKWIILAVVIVAVVAGVAGIVAAVAGGDEDKTPSPLQEVDPDPTPDVPNSPDAPEPPPPPPLTTAAPSTIRATSAPSSSPTAATTSTPTTAPTSFPIDDSYVAVGDPLLGATPLERFGDKVSMSSDGTIIAVGSPGHPQEGVDAGAVNVYQNRNGSWRPVGGTLFGGAAEEKFGSAVALSGDGSILVVGAPESFQDEGVRNPGFVRTFRLSSASQWEPIGIDLVGDSAGDRYGVSLALSRDGSTLVVGATQGIDGDGYAKVYNRNDDEGSGWKHLRTFTGDASDVTGYSVSVSGDGSSVAVGSYFSGDDRVGHVDVYTLSPNNIYVRAGSRLTGFEEFNYFGESVSLSANGEFLAVGIRWNQGGDTTSTGRVEVYRLTANSVWEQVGNGIKGQFADGYIGESVALSADGRTVVTSENGIGAGTVRVYHFDDGDWRQVGSSLFGETDTDEFGHSTAISDSGRQIVVGAPRNDELAGMAVVYEL